MQRIELEGWVGQIVESGGQYVFLLLDGDPSASRQRLLGHRFGPYGWVVGRMSSRNIVRFNAHLIREYLDELEQDSLLWNDETFCEPIDEETARTHSFI